MESQALLDWLLRIIERVGVPAAVAAWVLFRLDRRLYDLILAVQERRLAFSLHSRHVETAAPPPDRGS